VGVALSESLAPGSVTGNGYPGPGLAVFTQAGAPVPGAIQVSQSIVTFIPSAPLAGGAQYGISVSTQVVIRSCFYA